MGKFFEALSKTERTQAPRADVLPTPEATGNRPEEPLPPKRADARGPAVERKPALADAETAPVPMPALLGDAPPSERLASALVAFHKPRSFEAEQFKLLRTRLLFPRQEDDRPPRTLMVTSALPGEGKSFVSTNLAVSIAQGIKEHVLLIDCDLRRPTTHQLFGYSGDVPGLSRYLADSGTALPDVLLKTSIEKLTLLPAGVPVANPAELLSSPRMLALIGEVRARYDDRYIILDTPPPKMIAEANALARQVDGILMVVRYGHTPKKVLDDLVESLGKEKIIGTVMNRFDIQMGSLYGSYYNYRAHNKYYR